MDNVYKTNEQIKVRYNAVNKQSGLTDLNLLVKKPDDTDLSPIVMTEISSGIYEATFTPDIEGKWWVLIQSESSELDGDSSSYLVSDSGLPVADSGPKSDDGKTIVRAESRPLNNTTVFTCRGDSGSNIGDGKIIAWDFSNDDDEISAPEGYKRKRLEFSFLDGIYVKEGACYHFDSPKGCYVDFYIVCPDGQYYYDNNGDLKQASVDMVIHHYVNHHFIQGSVPMGDELNTESCSQSIPNNYKFWVDVTTPDSDVNSNGFISLEIYRERTVIL